MARPYMDDNTLTGGGAGQIFDGKNTNIIPIREVPHTLCILVVIPTGCLLDNYWIKLFGFGNIIYAICFVVY